MSLNLSRSCLLKLVLLCSCGLFFNQNATAADKNGKTDKNNALYKLSEKPSEEISLLKKTPSAPISSVTLYPNSALIERSAQVKAGDRQLVIYNIPFNFNANSLRIEAEKGIEIGDTTLKISERSVPLIGEEELLENEIRQLSNKLAELEVVEKAAQLELKYLESLLTPVEITRVGANQDLTTFLSSMHQVSVAAQKKIFLAEQNKEKITKTLQAKRNDLEKIRPQINQLVTITIRLDAKQSGKVSIVYPINDAGWRPAYRAYLLSDSGQLELVRTAQIAQKSGEDWQGVKVKLSTGRPNEKISGVTPSPWEINLFVPRLEAAKNNDAQVVAYAASPMVAQARTANKRTREISDYQQAPLFEVEINNKEYLAEYSLSQEFDLPADGRKANISLSKINLTTNLLAQTSPRIEKAAYLIAQSDLPEGIWPIGELQLYRDGAFIGVSQLDFTNQSKLNLSFGRDDLITVNIKNNENKLGNSGVFINSNHKQLSDSFIITNLHKKAVKVQILEATPLAQNEKIQIERKFNPPVTSENWLNNRGVVAWEQTVPSKGIFAVNIDYLIKWPENSQIHGLR